MEGIKLKNVSKTKSCSICGELTHNKRTCPRTPIDDTFIRDGTEFEYIEETIVSTPKEDALIAHILASQGYGIDPDIFEVWVHNHRPCPLKNIKYTMDQGFNKDYITKYLRILSCIDMYY